MVRVPMQLYALPSSVIPMLSTAMATLGPVVCSAVPPRHTLHTVVPLSSTPLWYPLAPLYSSP